MSFSVIWPSEEIQLIANTPKYGSWIQYYHLNAMMEKMAEAPIPTLCEGITKDINCK